ncbi:hypothetical protein Tco_0047631 [Tanacetum coccineum]
MTRTPLLQRKIQTKQAAMIAALGEANAVFVVARWFLMCGSAMKYFIESKTLRKRYLEGSAADSRVLRDATSRSNRLKVTYGNYYLCDAGYINGKGFLTPYRSQRYHLSDWSHPPMTSKEFYNKRHSSARNLDMTNSSLPSGAPASRLPRGAGKNKRVWTANEDVKLIDALMELHKSSKYSGGDNGFKPGYDKAVQTLLDVSL